MPSKNRGLLCRQMKARTEGSRPEFPEKVIPKKTQYTLSCTFSWALVLKLKSSCYLAGFLQLSASFPGLGEHGADNTLRTDMSSWLGVRNSTVRLIRMI